MAVLIEANSVVIRVDSILSKFKGGIEAFESIIPNQTACSDNELYRIGFMMPEGADKFTAQLVDNGLEYLRDGEAVDFVQVAQLRGFISKCAWAEFGHINYRGDEKQRIAASRMINSQESLYTPNGWKFEGSLSHTYGFIPEEQSMEKSLKFLRQDGGVKVYLNLLTGKEVYIGVT